MNQAFKNTVFKFLLSQRLSVKTLQSCIGNLVKTATLFLLIVTSMPSAMACSFGCFGGGGSDGPPPPPPPCNGSCCGGGGGGGGGEECPTQDQGDGGGCSTSGQPVELSSGRELITQTDLSVSGVRTISMVRKYDSQSEYDSPLGYGWAFTLDRRLYKYSDGSVVVRSQCGFRRIYLYTGEAYQAPIGESKTLTEQSDGSFILESPSGFREYYDTQGKLVANEDSEGNRLELTYVDSDADGSADRLPLVGSSPYAVDGDTPSVVAMDYRLKQIEERLASGTLTGIAVDFTYNDDTGRVTSIRANDGRTVTYEHDETQSAANGNLTKVNGLEGITGVYIYNDRNDDDYIRDAHNVTTFQHDDSLAAYTNTYNDDGKVIKQVHGYDIREYEYTAGVTSTVSHTVSDDSGNPLTKLVTTLNFDENNYTESKVDALYTYNTETSAYDLDVTYRIEQDRNSNASVIEERWYEQKPSDDEASLVRSKNYDYNADLQKILETITLDSGETITKTWGYEQGRKTFAQTVSSAYPDTVFRTEYTYYYGSDGRPTTLKAMTRFIDNETSLTTSYIYDDDGRLATTTLPDGHKLINIYSTDTRDAPVWSGTKLTQTYHQSGDTTLPQLALSFEYDAQGNLSKVTDAKSQSTNMEYDKQNRMLTQKNALQESTTYRYEDNLLMETEFGTTTDEGEGQVSRFSYTSKGELAKLERKNDAGTWITVGTTTYNSAGQVLTQTQYFDGNPLITSYVYDALGRMVSMTDAAGILSTYNYDALGNRIEMTVAAGTDKARISRYVYDDLNRLVQSVDDVATLSAAITYTYDAVDNLLTVTDPEQSVTTYRYDGLSRQTEIIQPLSQTVSYTYTDRNQVATMTNARNQVIGYRYEDWGALKAIDYYETVEGDDTPQVLRTVSYAYDNNGNLLTVADTDINNGAELYNYSYDALNRTTFTSLGYLSGTTLVQDYDRYGNSDRLVLSDSEAHEHSFVYNKLNELVTATLPGNQVWTSSYHSDASLMASLQGPTGINRTYQYHSGNGLLTGIQILSDDDTAIEQWGYTYDARYNIDSISSERKAGTTLYGYDQFDRLISANHPYQDDESYGYDLVGNRTNTGYDHNANHQVIQSPDIDSYSFDSDGNLEAKTGVYTYIHSADNRLTQFSDTANPENNASYTYDPFGRRIAKIVNAVSTYFVWDGDQILAEYDDTGSRIKRYAYLPGGYTPVQVEENDGSLYEVHSDHLDTPQLLTDQNNAVVWSQTQAAFGEMAVNEDVDGDGNAVSFAFRFPGQTYDEESGAYYNWHRYYDPSLGRYVQSDPIGLEGGLNTYGYVFQNPIMNTDPTGLICGTGACVGIAVAVGRGAQIGYRGYRAYQAARALQGVVDGLNDRTADDGISVPYPPRKRGKYTCICRVQKDGRSPDNCSNNDKDFGYGYGVADDLRTAKRQAEKMAKDTLGAKSTHHPQCRCTGPTGNPIIPHG